jgi:hypothetical protein
MLEYHEMNEKNVPILTVAKLAAWVSKGAKNMEAKNTMPNSLKISDITRIFDGVRTIVCRYWPVYVYP